MDIYGAGTNIKKLLAYVEDIADSKPRMYGKSKDRLKEIATTCNQVVHVISEILEEEVLSEDSVEFGQSSEIDNMLNDMQNQLDKIRQFTQGSTEPAPKVADTSNISSNMRKKALKNYNEHLLKMSDMSSGYLFADRCAKLLSTWFNVRFVKTAYSTSFRYNMKKVPEWIQSIVVLYGKAIQENNVAEFETQFQTWITSIVSTEAGNKYAVPYDVFQFCKDPNPETITLDAVILWDILLDNGLRDLCTPEKDDLYLDEYSIYNLCSSVNSDVLEDYCDYSTHPELFKLLKWEGVTNE